MGLGMGATDLELSQNLFKLQMQQAKRLWTADWAEASVRHGEACAQNAQQHAEGQALSNATYFQAEKLARQAIKLARDQDSRNYEMALRAEVRESLRDELANQYNRFNIVMLCDTVCLSCVFGLVAEGSIPKSTPVWMLNLYVGCMGCSITLFSVSLWCAVVVVRRLHEHTAGILERKLFAVSEDLRRAWRRQLSQGLPTGSNEMYLVGKAYEKWVAIHLNPIGNLSVHMMAFGVVMMFVTAGILTHNIYLIDYNTVLAVPIFWSCVAVTSLVVLFMKFAEDRMEKKKQGVYDNSWQDQNTADTDPFAKITLAGEQLFGTAAVELASQEQTESLGGCELRERDLCAPTKRLHTRATSLIQEADNRAATRAHVLGLLTTAAEELDALPEELTSRLNRVLHEVDEADTRTAALVGTDRGTETTATKSVMWDRVRSAVVRPQRPPMSPHPMDAQRLPLSLGAVRMKLGEFSLTTLLRLRNLSDEPLRLKSGVQLKQGTYIKALNTTDPSGGAVCHHLYPGTEIPPRSEVVVAARNVGVGWVPLSGIEGEIVYTNRTGSWLFRIKFGNHRVRRNLRSCQVFAVRGNNDTDDQFGNITKDELDIKSNNEIAVSMDVLRGEEGRKAELVHRHSQATVKTGILLKHKLHQVGLQWLPRRVVLTPTELIYSVAVGVRNKTLSLRTISHVQPGRDAVKKNVLEIHLKKGAAAYRFSAGSPEERDDWIQKITDASTIWMEDDAAELSCASSGSGSSSMEEGFEVVQSPTGESSVLPFC